MIAHAHLLTRTSNPGRSADQRLVGDVALTQGRAHEFCGAARRTLALRLAAGMAGPVFWIAPSWGTTRLNPDGFVGWLDPGRITFVSPHRADDLLWSMEEVLRSGAVPLVVADLPGPPALTPVRRLHLAAETGAAGGGMAPIAVLLTPEGAAPGIESRWRLSPRHDRDREVWRLDRLRARTAPEASWHLEDDRLTAA